MENPLGAWQAVRKYGRAHIHLEFLRKLQTAEESRRYFDNVNSHLVTTILPFLTGKRSLAGAEEDGKTGQQKHVRFSSNQQYSETFVEQTWERFIVVVTEEATSAFLLEKKKLVTHGVRDVLNPHQNVEEKDRKRKKYEEKLKLEKERDLETSAENRPPITEELYEDPF